LPSSLRKIRAVRRLSERVEDLVMHNVENLRWATLQNLDRAFVRFARLLDESFEETITATNGAIRAACSKREQQADVIAEEVTRLKATVVKLESLRVEMKGA